MYDVEKERIFVYFPTETHEAMTKIFQSAFDHAMRDQDGENALPWESGTNKTIHIIKDEEIVAKSIPDFVIYMSSNDAILVIETAHSQNREEVREKARQWLKHPVVVACIVIHVPEQPRFTTKSTPPVTPPMMKHWEEVQRATPMGPYCLHDHNWVGGHSVSIEIFEKGEQSFEVVRAIMFHSPS